MDQVVGGIFTIQTLIQTLLTSLASVYFIIDCGKLMNDKRWDEFRENIIKAAVVIAGIWLGPDLISFFVSIFK